MDVIPTGSLFLDRTLGVGGLPTGWITELYGPPSSGKTTLALHILAEAQRIGLTAAFLDIENGLEPAYAMKCGVNPDQALIASPDSGTQALTLCQMLLKSGHVHLVVLDSLAGLTSNQEAASGIRPDRYGELNPLLASHLRKIDRICRTSGGTLLCTNQLRTRTRKGYGTPETTPGGLTIKFHAAVRIALKVIYPLGKSDQYRGIRINAAINKNRFHPKKDSAQIDIVYNKGVNKERELFSLGKELQLITKQGPVFQYRGHDLGQGHGDVLRTLQTNEPVAQALERDLRLRIIPHTS